MMPSRGASTSGNSASTPPRCRIGPSLLCAGAPERDQPRLPVAFPLLPPMLRLAAAGVADGVGAAGGAGDGGGWLWRVASTSPTKLSDGTRLSPSANTVPLQRSP